MENPADTVEDGIGAVSSVYVQLHLLQVHGCPCRNSFRQEAVVQSKNFFANGDGSGIIFHVVHQRDLCAAYSRERAPRAHPEDRNLTIHGRTGSKSDVPDEEGDLSTSAVRLCL